MNIIGTLHPEGSLTDNLYPNIKKENIPNKSISTDKLDNNVLSLIGSLKPSGTDTSTNILAFTSNKGIYVATDNGHWYYWNGSAYADGGLYLATPDQPITELGDEYKGLDMVSVINKICEDFGENSSGLYILNDAKNSDKFYFIVLNYQAGSAFTNDGIYTYNGALWDFTDDFYAIGNKTNLQTNNKTNLVNAINELVSKIGDINTILDKINGEVI